MTHRFRDTALLLLAGLGVACSTHQAGPPAGPAGDNDVGRFVWQELLTEDLQAARSFYGGLFGWQFEQTERLGKPYAWARSGADFVAGIVEVERQRPDEPVAQWLSYVLVADLDAAAKTFVDAGGLLAGVAITTTGCTASVGVGVSYGYPGTWYGPIGYPGYIGGPWYY